MTRVFCVGLLLIVVSGCNDSTGTAKQSPKPTTQNNERSAGNSETMSQSEIEEIKANDEDLCHAVWCLIADYHETPEELSACRKNVYHAMHFFQAVDGGGVKEFLTQDCPMDPDYTLTQTALAKVGANNASEIVGKLIALFPGSAPPKTAAERLKVFQAKFPRYPTPLDEKFSQAGPELQKNLANYIRQNFGDFQGLNWSEM